MTSLDGWENFYIIIGSSAAALTGLMFVVITLTAETRASYEDGAINAFATPTVSHFCFVLLIAAIVSVPHHTVPVVEDWVWHVIFPFVSYASVAGAAAFLWQGVVPMLYFVAAAALLLLYAGIHNAWDAAMWMAVHERKAQSRQ